MLDVKNKDNVENFQIGDKRLKDLFNSKQHFMIVGYGSNANPPQLVDKFKDRNEICDLRIPVLKGCLRNYDIVYSARFSRRGYLPVTITKSSGDTTVEAWANILDEAQLKAMDETEGRCKAYCLAEIPGGFEFNGKTFSPVYTYVAKSGPLLVDGSPMKLAMAHDEGQISKRTQCEIIRDLIPDVAPECEEPDQFVSMIKCNAKKRDCINDKLDSGKCDKEFKPLRNCKKPMPISEMKRA